ncbi:hybrid sensor histidine kinase/response regulator, partial [Vibrio parahaemolyticus]|nr:hybrid sensor histidine kinase/response regulator [Vibrio parahaemolyticus]
MLRLSIKTRLALLALLPAVVIVVFSVQQFSDNALRVSRLNQTVSNIQGFQLISKAPHFIYSIEKVRRQPDLQVSAASNIEEQGEVISSLHQKFVS